MGKGSNIKGLGSSWMSKHARNLLQDMPIDNRASGRGPGEYGKPKGPGKHGYGPHIEHGDGPAQFIKLPESTKQKFRDLVNPDKYKGALTKFKNTVIKGFF